MMRLGELAQSDESLRLFGDPLTPVSGLAYDIRAVGPGELFAALDGEPFRGHGVAPEAVERGASALLLEKDLGLVRPTLYGPEPRASLARIAAAFHGHPSQNLDVIGVTGTDGKTTAAHLIETILREAGLVTGAITTVAIRVGADTSAARTRLTTPEAPDVQALLRRMADAGVQWAIVEATSHGLALNRLDEVRFAIGAVTNVTHEHLDFHRTPAGYRRAKAILLERARDSGGTAVINADDAGARETLALAGGARAILYGLVAPDAEVRALHLRTEEGGGSSFRLLTPDGDAPARLPLAGRFNVANALCAAAVAHVAGVPTETIAAALAAAKPVPGRLTVLDAGQPFAVVVDYAHSPAAVEQMLGLLRDRYPEGRLIAVLGSAGQRDLLKRPWLGEIAERLADYSVFTSEDPRLEDPEAILGEIAAGAISAGGREGETFVRVTERSDAVRHALETARSGDCVVLFGKGHERTIVWGNDAREWDEVGVVRGALADLGYRG